MRNRPLFRLILMILIPLTILRVYRETHRVCEAELPAVVSCRDLTAEALVAERIEGTYRTGYILREVTVYTEKESIACGALFASCQGEDLVPCGMKIRCRVKLRKFEGAANPGCFDEEKYYRAQGLSCAAEISEIEITGGRVNVPREALYGLQKRLGARFDRLLPEEEAGLARAILLGMKGEADPEVRDLYADHGIAHILAISGLHIQLLGMGCYEFFKKRGLSARAAAVPAGAVVVFYGMLTGMSVSCARAVIMCLVRLYGLCRSRTADTLTSAAIAAALILLAQPMAVTGSGFLLSFGAVFGTAVIAPMFREQGLPSGLAASFAVMLVLMPFLLLDYAVIAPYGILLNLAVVPLMPLLMVILIAGLIISFVWSTGGAFLLGSATAIFRCYELFCRVTDALPGHLIVRGRPAAWVILLYAAGVCLGLYLLSRCAGRHGRKWILKRVSGWCVILVSCVILLIKPAHRGLTVTGMDVSQGDGFLVQIDDVNLLIDGGSSDRNEIGDRVLKPVLRSLGVDHIDYAVITHWDLDHVSGVKELLEEDWLSVDCVLLPAVDDAGKDMAGLVSLEAWLTERGISWETVGAGESLSAGAGVVTCLSPERGARVDNANNASVVLGVRYGTFSMLFTGDLGGEREGDLLRYPGDYTVLKAAHHGSAYSNSAAMLAWCRPEACVVSCGKDNAYGHPHPEFLARLTERKIPWYVTAECGAVIVRSDGEHWSVRGWKER